jgi:hypothetical protein
MENDNISAIMQNIITSERGNRLEPHPFFSRDRITQYVFGNFQQIIRRISVKFLFNIC